MHPLLPTNEDGSECILFPVPVEPPTSATLFIDLYQHCITPNHYALISKPVFHRSAQDAYRQLGRMSMRLQVQESESLLNVTIYWMGGHNLDRSFSLLDSTSEYTFQVSRDPDTQTVSCISPPPGVDINVFPKHPFYLHAPVARRLLSIAGQGIGPQPDLPRHCHPCSFNFRERAQASYWHTNQQ